MLKQVLVVQQSLQQAIGMQATSLPNYLPCKRVRSLSKAEHPVLQVQEATKGDLVLDSDLAVRASELRAKAPLLSNEFQLVKHVHFHKEMRKGLLMWLPQVRGHLSSERAVWRMSKES